MSRIGKQPISVPASVKVDLKGQHITVTGNKGSLDRDFNDDIEVVLKDNQVFVNNRIATKKVNALRGLTRSLVDNMIIGVDEGFKKVLIIEGVGYKAKASGQKITLNVGYSNPYEFVVPKGVNATVDGSNKITLESIDKELLGLTAAKLRDVKKPEPYKGKGIRYEDEYIARKVGKAGGAA